MKDRDAIPQTSRIPYLFEGCFFRHLIGSVLTLLGFVLLGVVLDIFSLVRL